MTKNKKEIIIATMLTIIAIAILGVVSTVNVNADNKHGPNLSTPKTIYVGGTGAGNYSTIQGGINVAGEGDTVFVYSGTYYENVIIDKTLTLIGEDRNNTIIDGNGTGDVIHISADWVNVSGVGVRNGHYSGIYLSSSSSNSEINNCALYNNNYGIDIRFRSSNNTIINCIVHENDYGIYLYYYSNNNHFSNCMVYNNICYGISINRYSSNNTVNNCTVYNNYGGVYLDYSSNNTISNCAVYNNYRGIRLYPSKGNKITECKIHHNTEYGIYMWASSNVNIINCTVYSNSNYGIYIYASSANISNSAIYNNDCGVYLYYYSNNNQFSNCTVYNNSNYGIYMKSSSNNVINNCTISNNSCGLYLSGSSGNIITNNTVYNDSDTAIYLSSSSYSNNIYHNNFVNNANQSYDECTNFWDNGIEGNYWSDYTGVDEKGDGIGDAPYNISGGSNQDHYPFINPSGWEEVSELMPQEPIYISGNDDFTLENGVVSGSGTEGDPYIIEGYDINANTASHPTYAGVHVENTDAYFIIRNCVIHDGYEEAVMYNYGIYFYNVTNGKIKNVTSYKNSFSIYLYGSSNNNIIDCAIYNNSWYGVYLDCSPNNTITNCVSRSNSDYGIRLYESANSTVTNCTIYNNSYGISLSHSLNCNVENCTVYNQTWYGISVSSQSSNNRIANCVVHSNSYYGIQISSSAWNVVINCSIYNNSRYGIYSSYSQYNQIANSILYNNTYYNIYLSSSLYDQVTNCVLYNSNYGAYLYSCLYDQISECAFYNNRYHGIYFTSSLYNQIANNKIINCSTGVCFYFSFYNEITNCTLNNNSYSGGYFQFSSNNTVTRCNISANNWGIYLYSNSNNNYIYHNSFINNTNNAYDEGMNYWDWNGEGNYWADYNDTDANGDGIGDGPYNISSGDNKDNYPLIHEFAQRDKEPPIVTIIEQSQTITATAFTMHWSTNATDIQFYEISADGENWVNVGSNISYTFTNLAEGINTLYVRGTDYVNNTGIPFSITVTVEISEEITYGKEEINWLLYSSIIIVIFIALILAGAGITGARRVKRRKVFYPQKLKCVYCQETMRIASSDRPLLFQCQKCGGKSVIR